MAAHISSQLGNWEEYGISSAGTSGDERLYRFDDEQGCGFLRVRAISPGITLMFNEYRLSECNSTYQASEEILALDFCKEGRMEYPNDDGSQGVLEAGDLAISNRKTHAGTYSFPTGHYVGLTLAFEFKALSVRKNLPRFLTLDYKRLYKRYGSLKSRVVLKSKPTISRLFMGFYDAPQGVRQEYYLCRALEVLLFLDAYNPRTKAPVASTTLPVVDGMHVAVQARELMVQDLSHHYTIDELSERFCISASKLKQCFKAKYEQPIFTYMRIYRINKAASLLAKTDSDISDIAQSVGYANPGKFSEAFREVIGYLPSEYRKNCERSKRAF